MSCLLTAFVQIRQQLWGLFDCIFIFENPSVFLYEVSELLLLYWYKYFWLPLSCLYSRVFDLVPYPTYPCDVTIVLYSPR